MDYDPFEDPEEILARTILEGLLDSGTDLSIDTAYKSMKSFEKKYRRSYKDLLEIPFCKRIFMLITEEYEAREEIKHSEEED
jgi:hypothetical protein